MARIASASRAAAIRSEDRISIREDADGHLIAVADGAGGMGGGADAAEVVVGATGEYSIASLSSSALADFLHAADHLCGPGQSTGILLAVTHGGIRGASVGDSQAIVITPDEIVDLTRNQQRKPLLGSGEARAVPFDVAPGRGTLIVATDGLWNYAPIASIAALVRRHPGDDALPERLIDVARLPNGSLQDDVAIVTVEL